MTIEDLAFVHEALNRLGRSRQSLIPLLQAVQEHYGYLPAEAMESLCRDSEIIPADVTGVSTFYSQFRHVPVGRHMISVCQGTACHVKGAEAIYEAFRRELGLHDAEDTDSNRLFTLQKVACLGCCTLAPAVQIDDVTYGHLVPQEVPSLLREFLLRRPPSSFFRRENAQVSQSNFVYIGMGSCCVAKGSAQVQEAFEKALWRAGVDATVKSVGCVGMCHQTPLVEIHQGDRRTMYARVEADDALAIVRQHFGSRGLGRVRSFMDRVHAVLASQASTANEILPEDSEVRAFLAPQVHIATEQSGRLNPLDIEEYMRHGGFTGLKKAREFGAHRVVEVISASGLAGRGGAGYPTGQKWQAVRTAEGECKYAICNGDEGDPGAFMDRMLLESYPYRVIEGLAIGALAVGAANGIFYIRSEYPLAVHQITEAITNCQRKGLLDGLSLSVMQGAGAFVCGEETALIASIEGRRGTPRLRPPYPAQSGLFGKPTLVNNVETLAMVPWIIRNGAEQFKAFGTKACKGTKVFALAGKVRRGGLIEVPMGTSIRKVVEEIGGGVDASRTFKAVQIGGPSGGCIPAGGVDVPIDYQALHEHGAIMGSGGLVVLDHADCMVDIARYFLRFTQSQSCGRCTFCRVGTRRMLDILDRLCNGTAIEGDLESLEQLAVLVKKSSLCGLGRTASNPVLSTLRHFGSEYQAHLEGRCPAKKCKALISYNITDKCIGCTLCAQNCPTEAISMQPYQMHEIDSSKCTRCDTCRLVCPSGAVEVLDAKE